MDRAELDSRVQDWLRLDRNPTTCAEISSLLSSPSGLDDLTSRFSSRIAFGTAGLRGPMQAGPSAMNDLVILQASQGLAKRRGWRVYELDGLVHTPTVPFATKRLIAALGVMKTASHNPAKDNGYKVYWSNAVQIIPPHDSGIAAAILESLVVGERRGTRLTNVSTSLIFTHTPMRGVGRRLEKVDPHLSSSPPLLVSPLTSYISNAVHRI
ncbi:hypothetical protein JCM8547_000144 [Rhodosporidiobolus lusitaniae]